MLYSLDAHVRGKAHEVKTSKPKTDRLLEKASEHYEAQNDRERRRERDVTLLWPSEASVS